MSDLVAEARRFLNYDNSTRMSKGPKSKRISLVERLANEIEEKDKEIEQLDSEIDRLLKALDARRARKALKGEGSSKPFP